MHHQYNIDKKLCMQRRDAKWKEFDCESLNCLLCSIMILQS